MYEYISENITAFLGHSPGDFGGPAKFENLYSLIEETQVPYFVNHVLNDVQVYLSRHATCRTGLDYRFSCSLKLKNVDNKLCWYMMDTVVLKTSENGFPVLVLVSINNINQFKKDDLIYYNILKKDNRGIYQVVFEKFVDSSSVLHKLTQREIEILSLIAKGLTNKEITEKLFISTLTVKSHRRNILSKTRCRGTAELTNFAFSRSLV